MKYETHLDLFKKLDPKVANLIEMFVKTFLPMGLELVKIKDYAEFLNFITEHVQDNHDDKHAEIKVSDIILAYNEKYKEYQLEDNLVNELLGVILLYLESIDNRYISLNISIDKQFIGIKGCKLV